MIRLPDVIYVATAPVNLHLSFDRLAGIVRQQLGGDPRGDALFFFHNRRGTHAKILWHDGSEYAFCTSGSTAGCTGSRWRSPPVPSA